MFDNLYGMKTKHTPTTQSYKWKVCNSKVGKELRKLQINTDD